MSALSCWPVNCSRRSTSMMLYFMPLVGGARRHSLPAKAANGFALVGILLNAATAADEASVNRIDFVRDVA